MTRPDPISWTPETMTKAEHRAEALHLMGKARRPQRPGEAPITQAGVTHFLMSAQLHLALSTDPLTPDERPEPAPADTKPEDPETTEYQIGWMDAVHMKMLHDRIPGFAITRPRHTDPFEFNKDTLREYGITTAAQMWDVVRHPHADPRAHPVKRTARPAHDDALPTTSDGLPAGD